jgi:peptide deformylase
MTNMAIRRIVTEGDPMLNKVCRPVEKFDERLHTLIDDMRETLIAANGIGLAAPQVGILRRVVVLFDGNDQLIDLVNPVIISQEGEQDGLEGCLSVPGLYGDVLRPMKAVIRAQDRNGEFFEISGEGITARCFCHETEHLDGHLFTEHVKGKLYTVEELEEMDDDQ